MNEQDIKIGLDKAYKKAGDNAYFGEGFRAGIKFSTLEPLLIESETVGGLKEIKSMVEVSKWYCERHDTTMEDREIECPYCRIYTLEQTLEEAKKEIEGLKKWMKDTPVKLHRSIEILIAVRDSNKYNSKTSKLVTQLSSAIDELKFENKRLTPQTSKPTKDGD